MLPLRPRDRAGPQRLAPEDPRPGRSTQWISFPESLTTPAPQSSHSQNVSAQRPVRGCDSEPSPSYRSRVSERFKDLPYCAAHLQPPSNGCALQNRRKREGLQTPALLFDLQELNAYLKLFLAPRA